MEIDTKLSLNILIRSCMIKNYILEKNFSSYCLQEETSIRHIKDCFRVNGI